MKKTMFRDMTDNTTSVGGSVNTARLPNTE